MRFNNPHYYKILEINETASQEEISAAFRRLAKEYHPDRIPSHLPRLKHEAQEKLKQINEAYRVLSDPEKRRLYDTYLAGLREEETEEVNKESNYDYQESDTEEEERTTTQETTKVIITCPNCEQKLRVPEGQVLIVRCSSCGRSFCYPFTESYEKKNSKTSPMPLLLKIIGIWAIIIGCTQLLGFLMFTLEPHPSGTQTRITNSFDALFVAAGVVMWIYVFKRRIWARTVLMVLYPLTIVGGIVLATRGKQTEQAEGIAAIIVSSLLLAYLSTKGVKNYFGLYESQRPKESVQGTTSQETVQPVTGRNPSRKRSIIFTILGLVSIFPLGLHLMWSKKHFPLWARITISACIGVMLITFMTVHMTGERFLSLFTFTGKKGLDQKLKRTQKNGMSLLDTIEKNLQSEKPLLSKQETGIGILSTQDIAAKYWNSVVSISTYDAYLKNVGQGSGLVVDQSGIIVTNNHVVQSSLDPLIIFPNKEYYYASVLRRDITHDIAILKIKADNLPTVPLGDLWKISVGEKIVVIGNPLGLQNTVTEGIVSAIRVLEDKTKILQISAPVSPGSSGSPVINSSGQCIGIATMIVTEGQNLNFAVPIEYVVSLLGASKLPDVPKDGVKWITSFEEGMQLAKEQGRPVFIDFFADWCLPCKEMEATTWRDERVIKESERFVAIKMDSSKDDSPGSRLKIEKFNSFYIPYVAFYDSTGNYLEGRSIEGYADANTMLKVMQTINETLSKEYGLEPPLAQSKSISSPPTLDPNKFYATKRSKTFHRSHCIQLDIKQELISFGSIEEAASLGGVPCNVCFTIKDKIK